ncbi:hypothetical protein Syun_009188 [Stephania yunnanensis]|uniref:Uncharacterized protein n=1 Tax=Stephania yunnanensis TaxID=152371 RepID=A0AAP0PQE7_9MAGN
MLIVLGVQLFFVMKNSSTLVKSPNELILSSALVTWTWVEVTPPDFLVYVHDALDCNTCDPTLSEWRPELALSARVGDSANLASAARDQVSGQLNATTSGNLMT